MNRILFAAPLALAVSALFIGASIAPAAASEDICTVMPQNVRAAAAAAEADVARKALKYAHNGVLLCDAGNERAAKKKFEIAFKTLGTTATEYAEVSK